MHGDDSTSNELTTTSIKITKRQKQWLDEHSEVNLSGFVRTQLHEAIETRRLVEELQEDDGSPTQAGKRR